MKCARLLFVSLLCCGIAACTVRAQPQMPKPGPEQDVLKKLEGIWDVTMKMTDPQTKETKETKGTSTYKAGPGGMWVLSDFQGEFGGGKFEGHGIDGYDPGGKEYVSVWVDSMSQKPMNMRGNWDADKKTMTMTGEGPGMDGKPAKYKSVSEWKDDDTFVMTMNVEQDGKDVPMFTITYNRKK